MMILESDKNVSTAKIHPTPMEPSHVQLYNYIQLYILRKHPHLVFFSNGTVALDWSGLGAVQSPT